MLFPPLVFGIKVNLLVTAEVGRLGLYPIKTVIETTSAIFILWSKVALLH